MREGFSCVLPESSSGDRNILKIPEDGLTKEERGVWLEAVKRVYLQQFDCEGTLITLIYKLKFAIEGKGAFAKYITQ
jgi:hypothetical protein